MYISLTLFIDWFFNTNSKHRWGSQIVSEMVIFRLSKCRTRWSVVRALILLIDWPNWVEVHFNPTPTHPISWIESYSVPSVQLASSATCCPMRGPEGEDATVQTKIFSRQKLLKNWNKYIWVLAPIFYDFITWLLSFDNLFTYW